MKPMKMPLLFLLCASLCGCFSRTQVASYDNFEALSICTPASDVRAKMGDPYAIHYKAPGVAEYEYIERIDMGSPMLVKENHYFFTVTDGYVVGKRMSHESPPAYDLIYQEDPNVLD